MNNLGKKALIFILAGFVSLATITTILVVKYNQEKNKKEQIDEVRPIFNTFDLPTGKVGEAYSALIAASVENLNVEIEGKIESGLPEGLSLSPCHTEFNNPKLQFTSVNSLTKCQLEGVPQKKGAYELKILFSIPEGKISTTETIPLIIE